MSEYPPHELNILFRAQHSTLWELADKSGILGELGLSIKSLEFASNSKEAESKLFGSEVDFVAGNHITPYLWVARGRPIVCLASPGNGVRDSVISKQPLESLADLKDRGLRVADSNLIDPWGGIHHPRGNHILDVMRAGYEQDEVEWLELGHLEEPELPGRLIDAVVSDRADVAFGGARNPAALEKEGLHILRLPILPMVNGTTITTSYETLHRKEALAERLVKAMVTTIHYARVHPEESQKLLDTKVGKQYREYGGRAAGVARYPIRPYPTTEGVANAYELCCMQHEEAKAVSPLALWDMHYLRSLDLSGYIDELLQEEPEEMRGLGSEPSWIS